MGDSMYVVLDIGPLTEKQKDDLPEVMADFCDQYEIDYCPEIKPAGFVEFEFPDWKYGIGSFNDGDLTCLKDAGMPYRIADDGGCYETGRDAIWHPSFNNRRELRRETNQDLTPVVGTGLIDRMDSLTDQQLGQLVRGLTRTNPADPALVVAYKLLANEIATP